MGLTGLTLTAGVSKHPEGRDPAQGVCDGAGAGGLTDGSRKNDDDRGSNESEGGV